MLLISYLAIVLVSLTVLIVSILHPFLFQGQRTYLGPALLHMMETLPCVKLDIPALFSNSARSPEEAITQLIHTARRTQPGVLYIPHLLTLWDTVCSSFALGT